MDRSRSDHFFTSLSTTRLTGAVAVGFVTFGLFAATAAPGLTWKNAGADGGDLLTAVATWGIPHPSGYPTYLLLLRGFSLLDPVGSLAGRGNLFSAVCGSAAAGIAYVAFLMALEIAGSARRNSASDDARDPRFARFAAGVGALAFAVSPAVWSQSTITEVYALNAWFCAAILALSLWLYRREQAHMEVATYLRIAIGVLLGLGLGNHLTLAMLAIPLLLWTAMSNRGRPFVSNTVARLWPVAAGGTFGLLVYLYAPIASSHLPPVNWGHPNTLRGFWWMLSGSIYQQYAFAVPAGQIPGRLVDVASMSLTQFGFVGLIVAIVGVVTLVERARGLGVAIVSSILLLAVWSVGYRTLDSYVYLIPAYLLLGLCLTVAIPELLSAVDVASRRIFRGAKSATANPSALFAGLLVLAAIPGWTAFHHFRSLDLHHDTAAEEFVSRAFSTAGADSVIFASDDKQLFSLWYEAYVAAPAKHVMIVSVPHLQFNWYWNDLARQYPNRMPSKRPDNLPERISAIVGRNLGKHPVFVANEIPSVDQSFNVVKDGPLWQIAP